MRRSLLLASCCVLLALAATSSTATEVEASPGTIRWLEFEGPIHPWSAQRILRSIDDAEAAGDELVLIRLDTPGGLVSSMGEIVKRMLGAKVPIVVWVGPPGAHAASAGFFILIAADVAAMAPGTRTGAAATIIAGGENREDDVLLKKANQDNAALLRSIADRRGRNVEACEEAIFAAKAFEEQVALDKGLIDFVAGDRDDVLRQLDGRKVTLFDGSTVVLHTEGTEIVTTEFDFKQRVMEVLGSPTIAIILFLLAMLGIYVEFSQPGLILPGVVGVLCLLLFLLSAQSLPISAIGVLLILLAGVMFILEVKVTSYGMLTVGGIASLILGSWMLVDGPIPELRVPLELVIPMSIAIGLFCVFVLTMVVRAHGARVATGVEGLSREIGQVTIGLDPEGKIFIHGETWDARTLSGPIAAGSRVRVVRVDNLSLIVEPLEPGDRS